MNITIECPSCKQNYSIDESLVGEEVECAVCNAVFVAIKKAPIKLQLPDNQKENSSTDNSKTQQTDSSSYVNSNNSNKKHYNGLEPRETEQYSSFSNKESNIVYPWKGSNLSDAKSKHDSSPEYNSNEKASSTNAVTSQESYTSNRVDKNIKQIAEYTPWDHKKNNTLSSNAEITLEEIEKKQKDEELLIDERKKQFKRAVLAILVTIFIFIIGVFVVFYRENEFQKGMSAYKAKDYVTAAIHFKNAKDLGYEDAGNYLKQILSSDSIQSEQDNERLVRIVRIQQLLRSRGVDWEDCSPEAMESLLRYLSKAYGFRTDDLKYEDFERDWSDSIQSEQDNKSYSILSGDSIQNEQDNKSDSIDHFATPVSPYTRLQINNYISKMDLDRRIFTLMALNNPDLKNEDTSKVAERYSAVRQHLRSRGLDSEDYSEEQIREILNCLNNARKNDSFNEHVDLGNGINLEMVKIEHGTFMMGKLSNDSDADDDETPHSVTLTKDYWLGKYEITQEQWKAVMGNNPSFFKGDKLPVECVSWNDIQEFCKKLNAKYSGKLPSGFEFRLPTEAEWEYAAKGGKKSNGYKYSGSNTIGDVAWYVDNFGGKTHEVGTKKENELGLYDMSGNVWEWCYDWYGEYSGGSQTDPVGSNTGSGLVFRGGCWSSLARGCRSSDRYSLTPSDRTSFLGFRLALAPAPLR